MKRILLITILSLISICGAKAQNIGETWTLNKVEIIETTANGTTTKEIPATETNTLSNLLGPKEMVFLEKDQLKYKRMNDDSFEIFSYSRAGNTLEVELSECLLKVDIETKSSAILLSENKNIDEHHTVKITYSYIKQ